MSKFIGLFIVISILISCGRKKSTANRFKQGVFEVPAGKGYSKTMIIRKDSLQIESYSKLVSISTDSSVFEKREKRIDTLYIKWKNNFSYSLKMKSPKTELDKSTIFVQITKVTDSSYIFLAKIGFSNFKQKGVVYKLK